MSSPKWNQLIKQIEKKDGVFLLTKEMQKELNRCSSTQEFPFIFVKPILHPKLKFVERKGTGRCVIATGTIKKGDIICEANSSKINKPLKYSWQIEEDVHLIGPGALDHSCMEPNCGIDLTTHHFIALRTIHPGEMVTFNYLTTEYDMNEPFTCICGHESCFGTIRGFKYLTSNQKQDLIKRFPVAPYLKKYV